MQGEPAPTAEPREAVRIVPVPLTGEIAVLFCGPYEGLLVHRHQGRPYGCPGEESCPLAVHRSRTLWYGYAPVHLWRPQRDDWLPGVLEITEALDELLRDRRLRGELWMLQRSLGKKKTGPVTGVLLETREDVATPPPFDVRTPLFRLYHSTALQLGVGNPLPRKLVMAAQRLAPPPTPGAFGLAEAPTPTPATADALRRLAPHGLRATLGKTPGGNGHEKR
jgi:hypothetical protein